MLSLSPGAMANGREAFSPFVLAFFCTSVPIPAKENYIAVRKAQTHPKETTNTYLRLPATSITITINSILLLLDYYY